MSNVNLLRDLNHIDPNQLSIGWSAFATLASRTIQMNSDAIVNQTKGSQNEVWSTLGGTGYLGSGLFMSQPIVDDTPYRVKLTLTSSQSAALAIGYGPSAPTGTNDQVTKCSFFPLTLRNGPGYGQFDDIVLLPGLPQGDPDFQKPIAFAILVESTAQAQLMYHLSVQNLAKTAPQFATSMS